MTKISNGRLANTKKEIEMITFEDKRQLIHPGCIVIAKMYDPFTKTMKTHPYYVWRYNGNKEGTCYNLYAFRITSKPTYEGRWWCVAIKPSETNSLEKDSYIVTDAIHILSAENSFLAGFSDAKTFYEVIKARQKVQQVEITQAIKSYGKIKEREFRYSASVQDEPDDAETDLME